MQRLTFFIIFLHCGRVLSLLICKHPFYRNNKYLHTSIYAQIDDRTANRPINIKDSTTQQHLINRAIALSAISLYQLVKFPVKSNAIGSLFEARDQNMVLQDISFNVPNVTADAAMLQALFIDRCQLIRSPNPSELVLGFGPDTYSSPKNFIPGVSSFQEYGGHATLTLYSQILSDESVEIYERGNGLQFIKIGAEEIRLSKAIDKGATTSS